MALGWLRRLGGFLTFPVKARRRRPDPRAGFSAGPLVGALATGGWDSSRTDQVRAFRHWTYVAVDLIARRVACQFPNVGTVQPRAADPKQRWLNPLARQKALTPLYGLEDIRPADPDHPLVRLFADPNEPDTAYDLWYETVLHLYLTGSAYWWVPRSRATRLPAALWVVPSHWTHPEFGKDGSLTGYHVRPDTGGYYHHTLPADEVIHLRFKSPTGKYDGYSPQEAGAQWLDSQMSVDRSRWYTFKNGAFPAAALEFDPQHGDPDDAVLDRIEQKYLARYAGETRAGKPLLLPPGVKFHKLSVTPREMDYPKSADQLRDQILALYRVPAVLAGVVQETTGQAILAAHSLLCANAINPLCRLLGQTLTQAFAHYYGDPTLRVWWDDTTPDDPTIVEKQLQNDVDALARTPNEIRALRGLPPYAHGGDDPIMPHVGLVLPWGTGQDVNAVNPFGTTGLPRPGRPPRREDGGDAPPAPKPKPKPAAEDD